VGGIIQNPKKALIKIKEIPKTWIKTNDLACKPTVIPITLHNKMVTTKE
jgi:hypothetical protein